MADRICQRAVEFDAHTGHFAACAAEIGPETPPMVVGVQLGDEIVHFVLDVCQFHVIAAKFQEGNVAPG